MTVIINNQSYENVQWDGNSIIMETNLSLSEIESAFAPNPNYQIVVMDGAQEIAKYYNKSIVEIRITKFDPRTVIVVFNATQISGNVEEELRESIDDSDGAIMELAEIISEFAEKSEQIDRLSDATNNLFIWQQNMMNTGTGIIDKLTQRIIVLEDKEAEQNG